MSIPPGSRRVSLEEEAAKLTARRARGVAHVLVDEMQPYDPADPASPHLYIKVTSSLPPDVLTVELGAQIGAVVRAHCWPEG